MTDLLGDCRCSCCRTARIVVADLQSRIRAVEDRAAADRRRADDAEARLPHGGYGPTRQDPKPPVDLTGDWLKKEPTRQDPPPKRRWIG